MLNSLGTDPAFDFEFEKDSFRDTNEPEYANGRGQLGIRLGGVDNINAYDMSASIKSDFMMPVEDCVEISFEYILDCQSMASTTAYGELLLSIDSDLYGVAPLDSIHTCSGDQFAQQSYCRHCSQSFSTSPDGWALHSRTLPNFSTGTHTLRIGAYLSRKSASNQYLDLDLRNIRIRLAGGCTTRRTRACRSTDGGNGGIVYVRPNLPRDATADASIAIQEAIDEADFIASTYFQGEGGTCTVQVSLPPRRLYIHETLFVRPRVHLQGAGANETLLTKVYMGNTGPPINLGDYSSTPEGNMHLSDFSLEMQDENGGDSLPGFVGVHCIRSGKGLSDFELRNLKLERCSFYGIGLQMKDTTLTSPRNAYQRFSIQNVKISIANSDGIDMKALDGAETDPSLQNKDGEFENIYVRDIGQNDDGWASAMDLAGDELRVSNFMAINSTPTPSGVVIGLNLRNNGRRVTDSVFEGIYVQGFDRGIAAENGCARSVVSSGTIANCETGVILRQGSSEMEGKDMCFTGNEVVVVDSGIDNSWDFDNVPNCPVVFNSAFFL